MNTNSSVWLSNGLVYVPECMQDTQVYRRVATHGTANLKWCLPHYHQPLPIPMHHHHCAIAPLTHTHCYGCNTAIRRVPCHDRSTHASALVMVVIAPSYAMVLVPTRNQQTYSTNYHTCITCHACGAEVASIGDGGGHQSPNFFGDTYGEPRVNAYGKRYLATCWPMGILSIINAGAPVCSNPYVYAPYHIIWYNDS